MKKISVDDTMQILEKSEKAFNDMVDWHIAAFQEQDRRRQQLYYTIYENKRKAYYELMEELWRQYEQ